LYYTYILRIIPTGRFYKGHTKDFDNRLKAYNHKKISSTKY